MCPCTNRVFLLLFGGQDCFPPLRARASFSSWTKPSAECEAFAQWPVIQAKLFFVSAISPSHAQTDLFVTHLPCQWTGDDDCLLSQSTTGLVKKLKLQRKESREKTLKKENCQQKVLDGHPEDIRCLSDGPGTRIEQAYRGTILLQSVPEVSLQTRVNGNPLSLSEFWKLQKRKIWKLIIKPCLPLTEGWLDFHPAILGQMDGNPTNPWWDFHPLDGFPSSGWNSIHTG